jgi:truncated hemoglobin YjbI
VRAVLEDFYAEVYLDPQLASFFGHVTIERSIDKQYSFLRHLMTGEPIYFGDRPRNAHHWMVIPTALFDYRQQLMLTTLQKHGLSPVQIARWSRLEQHFRADIVKDAAWPRQLDGVDLPLDTYARETLSEATLCDQCGAEIASGTEVLYHQRLGHVSCNACAKALAHQA